MRAENREKLNIVIGMLQVLSAQEKGTVAETAQRASRVIFGVLLDEKESEHERDDGDA